MSYTNDAVENVVLISATNHATIPILKYSNIPNDIKISLYDDSGVIGFPADTKVFVSAKHTNNPLGIVECSIAGENNQIIVVPLSNIASRGCYLECELLLFWYNNTPYTLKSGKFYIISNGTYVNINPNQIVVSDEIKDLLSEIDSDNENAKSILSFMNNYRDMMRIKEQRFVEVLNRAENIQSNTLHDFNFTSSSYKITIPKRTAPMVALNKLGHISHSNNLCTTEGEYVGKDVSELVESDNPYGLDINLGELDAGGYYVDLQGVYGGEDGLEITIDDKTDSVFPFYFTVDEKKEVHLGVGTPFYSQYSERNILQGKIESLMVYKPGDNDTAYKPHISNEKPAKICSFAADGTLLDCISIPEPILRLEGYGLGRSQSECNYIDFDRKVFVNFFVEIDGTISMREEVLEIDISEYLGEYMIKYIKVQENGYIKFLDEDENDIFTILEFTFLIKAR